MAEGQVEQDAELAPLTTFRVGGAARRLVRVRTDDEVIAAVQLADSLGQPLLILGGGSNMLIDDRGFPGTVVKLETSGIAVHSAAGGSDAVVSVAAGEDWDAFVAYAIQQGWSGGIEALAGIPGLVGATPIQNVGAYGAEVGELIESVRVWDRTTWRSETVAAADCGFGYRWSRFKAEPGRHVILEVTFRLPAGSLSAPVRYAELARALEVEIGEQVPAAAVREAVLALRAHKGMVLDADDHDTWSAGSFFTNPVLPAEAAADLPADAPRYPAPDGQVKLSAAWLIEHAGFGKGYGKAPAAISGKHTLALTNRGGAHAADLLALAREVQAGVSNAYGVSLQPEPVLVGCRL